MVTIESGPEWNELDAELRVQYLSILGLMRSRRIVDIFCVISCSPCLPLLDFVLVPWPLVKVVSAVFSSLVVSYSQSCRITALLKYIFVLFYSSLEPVFVRIVDNLAVSPAGM